MNEILMRLAQAFQTQGYDLYLVGGTVRDELLGRPSRDIDCATDARPDTIQQIAATTSPWHIMPIGEKFGTIRVEYETGEAEPLVIEITTYRGERYTPGSRKPEVQFGTDLVEDLRRRDFTINAIAKHIPTSQIVDPFHGCDDLARHYLRAVEHPAQRFADDPLRMLRAARFIAELDDFCVLPETSRAIKHKAATLAQISQERIRDEFSKILVAPHWLSAFLRLHSWGLLAIFLPEVIALQGVAQQPHHSLDVLRHTQAVMQGVPPRLPVRLAALFHDIAKPQTRTVDENGVTHFYQHEDLGADITQAILSRLHYPATLIDHVARVVRLHMRVNAYAQQWSNGAVRRLYLDAGDTLEDLLDLAIADGCSDRFESEETVRRRIEHLRQRLRRVSIAVQGQPIACPLSGEELMQAFGRGPGVWIGQVKRHLRNLVVEEILQPGEKADAIKAAQAFLDKQ